MAELDSGIAGEQCKIQKILFMENKNTTHIVSDIAQGMGVLWDRSKPQFS